MKLLTFVVPCYNSESYMERCINTLLAGGDEVEIIIVNDGSTDSTGFIADRYQSRYPGIVRAVHQSNLGHGGAVNTGLKYATGRYFKVVDSDDWLDTAAFREVLQKLEQWEEISMPVDLLVCNYIYDHVYENKRHVVRFRNVFRSGEMCSWNTMGRFLPSQYLIMHALIFRTQLLRNCGLDLPHHTFYVDNIFAYQPLPHVKSICYLDVGLYHYFIGRADQSVNERIMMARIDQQILVTKIIAKCVDIASIPNNRLTTYLTRNISIMLAISSVHLLMIGTEEAMQKRRELWEYIRTLDDRLYKKLRYKTLSGLTCLPGKVGSRIAVAGYRAAKRFYKFQ